MGAERAQSKGFTLIELVLVIFVLGVLAVVSVAVLTRTHDDGVSAACAADHRTLVSAQTVHLAQYGAYGSESDLVERGLIRRASTLHDVEVGDDRYAIVARTRCDGSASGEMAGGTEGPDLGDGADASSRTEFAFALSGVPATVSAGVTIGSIRVQLLDADGAPSDRSDVPIRIRPVSDPPVELHGTTSVPTEGGVAVFDDLLIQQSARGVVFVVEGSDATATQSSPVDVVAAEAVALQFTQQPSGGSAARVWSTQPVVSVVDQFGNVVADDELEISLDRAPGNAAVNRARLACETGSASTNDGVARFAGCSIDRHANGQTFQLVATTEIPATGTIVATSEHFEIAGVASRLAFTVPPTDTVAGRPFDESVAVEVLDDWGTRVRDLPVDVTATFNQASRSRDPMAVHSASAVTVDGVATFPTLTSTIAITREVMFARASRITTVRSTTFAVAPAAPDRVQFVRSPRDVQAGRFLPNQPRVVVVDEFGNRITNQMEVELTITEGTGAATAQLSCTSTIVTTSASGVADFARCSIDTAGRAYTLTASSPGVPYPATSSAFNIR